MRTVYYLVGFLLVCIVGAILLRPVNQINKLSSSRLVSQVGEAEASASSSAPVPFHVKKRQAAIVLFGRVTDRRKSKSVVDVVDSSDPATMLTRVRSELEEFIIQPNHDSYNFTIIIRVQSEQDIALVRQVFPTDADGVLATDPAPVMRTTPGCWYHMYPNIQAGVQRMAMLEKSYAASDPQLWGEGFAMVVVIRSEVRINSPFHFHLLNHTLFYLPNACVGLQRKKNRVIEHVTWKSIPCLPNESLVIFPTRVGQKEAVLLTAREAASAAEHHRSNSSSNMTTTNACQSHRLQCRLLVLNRREQALTEMPDFFFMGNSTTIRTMFETIATDWNEYQFNKSHGQCNHGLIGGRMIAKGGPVQFGRYLDHMVDVEIPREASWYPLPSLHTYLARRGVLWMNEPLPASVIQEPTVLSRCGRTMCSIREDRAFRM